MNLTQEIRRRILGTNGHKKALPESIRVAKQALVRILPQVRVHQADAEAVRGLLGAFDTAMRSEGRRLTYVPGGLNRGR